MATATASLNLWAILSESKRIINAHSRHFLALSVIFLLPLSFSLIVSPFLFPILLSPSHSSHIHILLRNSQPQPLPEPQNPSLPFSIPFSLPLLLFFLFLILFSLCALASITHSVFHGFFGRPVKLLSALLSIPSSFSPLLATSILSHLILFSLSLSFPLLSLLLHQLGVAISLSSPIFLTASALLLFALVFAVIYLRVSWTLASVIVVAESTWGLQPLRRSASLMKGMKGVGASSFFFFASLQGLLLWSTSVLVVGSDGWALKI